MGTPFTFKIDHPVRFRSKEYTELRFSRGTTRHDLQAIKGLPGRQAYCTFYGRLAGVPSAVIDQLEDSDFVRLGRETDALFRLN